MPSNQKVMDDFLAYIDHLAFEIRKEMGKTTLSEYQMNIVNLRDSWDKINSVKILRNQDLKDYIKVEVHYIIGVNNRYISRAIYDFLEEANYEELCSWVNVIISRVD